ncbi:hypothetical protein EC988_008430 [Linderina pennispora]|nr:hypothetical protein EC988_008430 [Linderina pennispora]
MHAIPSIGPVMSMPALSAPASNAPFSFATADASLSSISKDCQQHAYWYPQQPTPPQYSSTYIQRQQHQIQQQEMYASSSELALQQIGRSSDNYRNTTARSGKQKERLGIATQAFPTAATDPAAAAAAAAARQTIHGVRTENASFPVLLHRYGPLPFLA